MNILGINGYTARYPDKGITHNAGAAWIEHGRIVAALDEERLSRKKNDKRFPFLSIQSLLDMQGKAPDFVAMAQLSRHRFVGDMVRGYWKAKRTARHPSFKSYLNSRLVDFPLRTLAQMIAPRSLPEQLQPLPRNETIHHLAHASSAYYCCPWPDEKVLTITLDGFGDGHCGSVWTGHHGKLEHLFWLEFLSSIGAALHGLHHAARLQATAARRQDRRSSGVRQPRAAHVAAARTRERPRLVAPLQRRSHVSRARRNRNGTRDIFASLTGDLSREDIASGLQAFSEAMVCDFIAEWARKTGIRKLALAGGVFANVKLNQRVLELDEVDNIYIHPNMGDGGLAVGAALSVHADRNGGLTPHFLESLYLGPTISDGEAAQALDSAKLTYNKADSLPEKIAALLAEGKVVARAAGRMEYGPRALGNRTVFASCSDPAINKWLNDRLQRTEFMPFAPIVIEEYAAQYFPAWKPDHVMARFMTITYDASELAKRDIPAAIHVDGTARPQVLREQDNPAVYAILKAFHGLTGVPALINTSFNMHEEPIVCSAADAVRAFQLGHLDALICGNLLTVATGTS